MLDGRKWTTIARPSQPWVEIAASQTLARGGGHLHRAGHPAHPVRSRPPALRARPAADREDRWMLLKTITAFTVAHSITLAIATFGYASAPVVPLNAAIALSILFLGPEIVRRWRGETSFTIRHPWVVAFAFGLLHGFGFAGALTSAGLPRTELPLALLLVQRRRRSRTGRLRAADRWRWSGRFACWKSGGLAGLRRCRATRSDRSERSGRFSELSCCWEVLADDATHGECSQASSPCGRSSSVGGRRCMLTCSTGKASVSAPDFEHPISGWDHVVAMIAVGLWGAQLGAPASLASAGGVPDGDGDGRHARADGCAAAGNRDRHRRVGDSSGQRRAVGGATSPRDRRRCRHLLRRLPRIRTRR